MKSIPSAFLDEAAARGYTTWGGNDWLWYGGVKDFMDGALGPQTAAMLDPYEGTGERGMLLKTEKEIIDLGTKAARAGLGLSVHAIGDLANRTLINAIEQVRDFERKSGIHPLPQRIEHVQLIDPADLPRMKELGIIASMQPIHATSDLEMADTYGGERTAYAYAPKHQFNLGTLVVFGSDAPVESPNPWEGIHAAVTRRRADGTPRENGWHPEGRLSRQQAIEGYTTNPARAAGRADRLGSLMPGAWADLTVLEIDPYSCPADQLLEIKPVGTMIAGEWVHRTF
jgi:predicted amidohydrolase YtcJ